MAILEFFMPLLFEVGEELSVAIQNLAAHCRNAHRAECLRFQMLLVILPRNNLHPPQSRDQNGQAQQNRDCQQPQLRVVLFQLVKN